MDRVISWNRKLSRSETFHLTIWQSDNLPWTHIWYRSRCDRHSGHLRLESLKQSNFCEWVGEPLPRPADILIPVLVLFPAHPSYSIVPVLNVKWTVPSMRRKSQGQKTVTVWEEICESLCLSADNTWYCVELCLSDNGWNGMRDRLRPPASPPGKYVLPVFGRIKLGGVCMPCI